MMKNNRKEERGMLNPGYGSGGVAGFPLSYFTLRLVFRL